MINVLIIVRSKTLIASDYYFWKNNKNFYINNKTLCSFNLYDFIMIK